VTPEGTRAIAELADLCQLGDAEQIARLIDYLVRARLLVTRGSEGQSTTVEIVHESLITSWPTLRRWIEETQEHAAFLAELTRAARKWDLAKRPTSLLLRGEEVEEARRFQSRFHGELAPRERAYLDAALAFATRATRRKHAFIAAIIALLALSVASGSVGLVAARNAERSARHQADVAEREADRARNAEKQVTDQLELLKEKEGQRQQAEKQAELASAKAKLFNAQAEMSAAELVAANRRLQVALEEARAARARSERESEKAKQAQTQIEQLYEQERTRRRQLERQRSKIATELK
jgi:hypothetical protein